VQWGKYGVQNKYSSIRIDLKPPFRINIYFVFLLISTALLLSSPFAINDAFAIKVTVINDAFDNNSPNELKWQMVFISSTPACSNYHYQMMYTYNDVVMQYLKLYELENISYDPFCITEKKYLSNYENPSDLDLLILVYDKNLGEKELHANQMGGLYTHSGTDRTQNHVIIICDCSNFDYSSPVWILSHELSHFILYYNNFEMTVIEKLIHVKDVKYDLCLKESTTCKSSSIKMLANQRYEYSVMPIYQPAVGLQTENDVINFKTNSPISLELSKIITQWWATDIISDGQYSNAIGYLIDSNGISSLDNLELILTDGPLEDVVTWEQMMKEITPTYWAHAPKSNDDSMAYLSKIPSNMISNDKNQFSEKNNFVLPEWFKETALWWGQDMITDKEFKKNMKYLVKEGIIESHSSSVFQELLVKSKSLPASTSIQSTSNEQNTNESSSQDPISEESSNISIESVTENDKNILVEIEGINDLIEFVNSMTDSGDLKERDGTRLMNILDTVVTAFDIGKIDNGCTNLENYFTVIDYLIDANKIVQSFGHSLIDAGDEVRLDSC